MEYTEAYYRQIDKTSVASARTVVPDIVNLLRPKTVLDVGGGTGAWAEAFQNLGVDAWVVDGPWVPKDLRHVEPTKFIEHDLKQPLRPDHDRVGGRVDLAVCLEVAEHLTQDEGKALVVSLTLLSDVVLFSAAVPEQGGDGHVNEQPPEYWDAEFAAAGYEPVRGFFDPYPPDGNVAWWYRQNALFYINSRSKARARYDLWSDVMKRAAPQLLAGEITPVILSCAAETGYTRRFVESYLNQVGWRLAPPVVIVDLTRGNRLPGSYLNLLADLKPRAVHIHPRITGDGTYLVNDYDSVQDAAFYALDKGLEEAAGEDWFLFLEDDVEVSSELVNWLTGTSLDPHAGFYSLYQSGGGYGSRVIPPSRFCCTQCVLFPKRSVELVLSNRRLTEDMPKGYDTRWALLLGRVLKRQLFASDLSYVQHFGAESRLGSPSGRHRSDRFVP